MAEIVENLTINETKYSYNDMCNNVAKHLLHIYISEFVVGLIVNLYLSVCILHQNHKKHGIRKMKPINIYLFDNFLGDAVMFLIETVLCCLVYLDHTCD